MSSWRGHLAVSEVPSNQTLTDASSLYALAFPSPEHDPSEVAQGFVDKTQRYVHERLGGRLAWTEDTTDGSMLSMALGVIGTPGTWWRDQVSSFLNDADTEARVLGQHCLEVVHLATRTDRRRERHGLAVLNLLLADRPAPTAVLTCSPFPSPASRLYLGAGWSLVAEDFALNTQQEKRWLMYKHLY